MHDLFNFSSLSYLDLSFNDLSCLDFLLYSNLSHLDLNNNLLNDNCFINFGKALNYLNMSNTKSEFVRNINLSLYSPKLEVLDLSFNNLSQIRKDFFQIFMIRFGRNIKFEICSVEIFPSFRFGSISIWHYN